MMGPTGNPTKGIECLFKNTVKENFHESRNMGWNHLMVNYMPRNIKSEQMPLKCFLVRLIIHIRREPCFKHSDMQRVREMSGMAADHSDWPPMAPWKHSQQKGSGIERKFWEQQNVTQEYYAQLSWHPGTTVTKIRAVSMRHLERKKVSPLTWMEKG